MATQKKLSDQIYRLVCSAPNVSLGEMEHHTENEIHPLKHRKEFQSHVELASALKKTFATELNDNNIPYQTIERKFSNFSKPNLNYYLKLLLAAIVVLAFGCFTGFYLNSLIFPQNLKQHGEQPSNHEKNDIHRETIKAVHISRNTLLNTSLEPAKIHAQSYTEYQASIYAIPDHQPVSVVIELTSPSDWPWKAQLARAEQVTSLKILGKYSLQMISFILSALQNLVSLTIIGNEYKLCTSEDMYDPTALNLNINLSRLRHLVFVNFTKCSYVLDIFANSPNTSGIRQLKIENGVVNKVNVDIIRAVINNNRHSLRKLCFPDTRWETTLLTEQFPLLSDLTLFRMDFITVNSTEVGYINTKLAIKFPNLTSFIAVKGFASWNDFRNILNINSLEILKFGIEIPKDRNQFKLNFLQREFRSLKEAYLSLNFASSSESLSSCSIYGIDSLKRSLKTLEIQTTCEIHLNSRLSFI